MATDEEEGCAPDPSLTATPPEAKGRRELTDTQAQLLALATTIGILALFVLLFSLLTGSL